MPSAGRGTENLLGSKTCESPLKKIINKGEVRKKCR